MLIVDLWLHSWPNLIQKLIAIPVYLSLLGNPYWDSEGKNRGWGYFVLAVQIRDLQGFSLCFWLRMRRTVNHQWLKQRSNPLKHSKRPIEKAAYGFQFHYIQLIWMLLMLGSCVHSSILFDKSLAHQFYLVKWYTLLSQKESSTNE